MDNLILSGGLAFLICYFSIPVIIEVANSKKLFDEPDSRKIHKRVVPTLGGLGIFAGFILATLIGTPPSVSTLLQYFIAASLVIFFLGVKDDILILSASKKFLGQLFAAGIIIKFGGLQIESLYGIFGIYEIPPTASILLTAFTIIVITNSFNLIDGVDGLAGSLGILTSLIFGWYFYKTGQSVYAVMAVSLAGSLLGFLIYNFSPAKIFMGDTGSLLIGLLNSIFVIKFITTAAAPDAMIPISAAPAIGFAILIVPLFDTLRVVTIRIFNRRSPFCPDRNHIHHFLLDLGLSHTAIVITCLVGNTAFLALAWVSRDIGITSVFAILFSVATVVVSIVYYSRPRLKEIKPRIFLNHPIDSNNNHKVITISRERSKSETTAI